MNIVEVWDNFTTSDKQMFQNCCRKLLKRTFLVRDKLEDRKHYFFVASRIEVFLDYFSYMGFEVRCDKDTGVIMLDNSPAIGDKEKLQSNYCIVLSVAYLSGKNKRGNISDRGDWCFRPGL